MSLKMTNIWKFINWELILLYIFIAISLDNTNFSLFSDKVIVGIAADQEEERQGSYTVQFNDAELDVQEDLSDSVPFDIKLQDVHSLADPVQLKKLRTLYDKDDTSAKFEFAEETEDFKQLMINPQNLPVTDDLRKIEFVDYDCIHISQKNNNIGESGIDWSQWLLDLESVSSRDWLKASNNYVQLIDRVATEDWITVAEECPLGFLTFMGMYLMQCFAQAKNEIGDEIYKMKISDIQKMEISLQEMSEQTNSQSLSSESDYESNLSSVKTQLSHIISQHYHALEKERQCYDVFTSENLVRYLLNYYPAKNLFGTRWPFLTLLGGNIIQDSLFARYLWDDRTINCLDIPQERETANWRKLHAAFWKHEQEVDPETGEQLDRYKDNIDFDERKRNEEWYGKGLTFVFHSKLVNGAGLEECPLGFYLTEVLRAFVAMTSESRFFLKHENLIYRLFDEIEPSHYLFGRWPFFFVFNHIRKSTRHKFEFDITIEEILDSRKLENYFNYYPYVRSWKNSESKLEKTPPGTFGDWQIPSWSMTKFMKDLAMRGSEMRKNTLRTLLRMSDVWHTEYNNANDIQFGAQLSESRGFAYTTMIYGSTFLQYLEPFIRQFQKVVQKNNLIIYTFDQQCYDKCIEIGYRGCVQGGKPSIVQKFTIPWILTTMGIDTVWLDFDVYLLQNPTPYLIEHALRPTRSYKKIRNQIAVDIQDEELLAKYDASREKYSPYEILISGSFSSPCICNGFVFFRATRHVILWLVDVLHWMYDHPYEHDQKCFSGWLNYTEPISFDSLPRSAPLPKWDTLDPVKRFITAAVVEGNGWMADSWEDIVMFHFLHGDSDKGGDLDSSGTWLKDSDLYTKMISDPSSGTNVTLMETFYGSNSTHEKRIAALERSRQFERIPILEGMTCGVISYPMDQLSGTSITHVPTRRKKLKKS